LFANVLLSSCGGIGGKDGVDTNSLKEALDKALDKKTETEEVTIESGGYKLSVPKHMMSATGLNADASLQYQNTSKELYIIVIDEPKVDFIKEFSKNEIYDDKLTPEKNYRLVQMESLQSAMTLRAEPGIKKTTINGLDAEIVDFTGKVPDIDFDIYYKLAFIEGTKNVYMVMTWTLDSQKNENNDEMDQMIKSFKLAE
jgi:hypothetical protein